MSARSETAALDALCPMHVRLSAQGRVRHVGPTMQKILGTASAHGKSLFDLFEVKRPRSLASDKDLSQALHHKLQLKFRTPPFTSLKGILVPMGEEGGDIVLNVSFGISIVEAVREFALTNADFAATDLAIEMLYLVEAKTAAMEASFRLNTRLQGAKIAAEEQAVTDTLTGLKNRRALENVLSMLLEEGKPFAVMQIDLDYFKAVNDTLGHAAGDHVLLHVAEVMVAETRRDDTVARIGGDEFTIVLPEVRSDEILRRIGQRIIDQLEKPIPFHGSICRISASIGTVWIQSDAPASMEALLADADVALYASKNAGRATQTLYSPELRKAANAVGAPQDTQDRTA